MKENTWQRINIRVNLTFYKKILREKMIKKRKNFFLFTSLHCILYKKYISVKKNLEITSYLEIYKYFIVLEIYKCKKIFLKLQVI